MVEDMIECSGMVLLQAYKELGRTQSILKELETLFDSVIYVPVPLLLTGVCFLISEKCLSGLQETLEEFLSSWNYVEQKSCYILRAVAKQKTSLERHICSSLPVEKYVEVTKVYVVSLLGVVVDNYELANVQLTKADLPEEKRQVVRLADEVESIFTRHFASSDRKRAMKFLRPQSQKDSHMITFLVGLFTGCFLTLFTVYAFLAHLSGMFSSSSQTDYMETVYPIFSKFALISLHVFLYGCNVCAWRSTRINYNFIFEFSPTTALKYRDVFLICTSIMTLVIGGMVAHLILRTNGFSPQYVDAIPGVLLLIFTGLLICPLNVFYRSTRYYFLRVMRNIICSPFYKVVMVDFFMADQLTSQVPLLRHMEFTACYFLVGGFKTHHSQTCTNSKLYKELAYVISFMPYYWRAMQCARRWFDEGDLNHIANLGKYVSAMLAAGARLTFAMQPTPLWLALVVITSTVATIYQLYWDFVKDWPLNPRSKNPWLRDDLIVKHKSAYYVAIELLEQLQRACLRTNSNSLLDPEKPQSVGRNDLAVSSTNTSPCEDRFTRTAETISHDVKLEVSRSHPVIGRFFKALRSFFLFFRAITLKLGCVHLVISHGRVMLVGAFIFAVLYIVQKKRDAFKRFAARQISGLKNAALDAWRLAFSMQMNPLAAIQPPPVVTHGQR